MSTTTEPGAGLSTDLDGWLAQVATEPEPALSTAASLPATGTRGVVAVGSFEAQRRKTTELAAQIQHEQLEKLRGDLDGVDVDLEERLRVIKVAQVIVEPREKAEAIAKANSQAVVTPVTIWIGGPRGARLRVQASGACADEADELQVVEDATVVGQEAGMADELPVVARPVRRRGVVDLTGTTPFTD